MSIYSDPTQIQTVSNTDYSVEELIEQFNTADQFGNRAQINQCIICAKIQQKLVAQFGNNSNSKAYKKEASKILLATKMKRSNFNKNAEIGRYVMQRNDPAVYDMPKSKIKELITPPKPKAPRTKKENPEVAELKSQLKQEQENNNTLVEHFTDTINTWETAFITIADYLDDRDIDWQQLLKKKGIKNPLDNS
jgi:hypothetical protein